MNKFKKGDHVKNIETGDVGDIVRIIIMPTDYWYEVNINGIYKKFRQDKIDRI